MSSRSRRHTKPANNSQSEADKLLNTLYTRAKAQFGDAVKSYWFYAEEYCPGCQMRKIGTIKMKGEDALSMNAFIYRARGVLIGYFLCEVCANFIFKEVEKNPHIKSTPLHTDIETNLIGAYHKHLSSLDA